MTRRADLLATLALLSPLLVTAAEDPKRVPKTGACPPGLFTAGSYCIPSESAKPA